MRNWVPQDRQYLMLQYLVGYGEVAPPKLPQVGAPYDSRRTIDHRPEVSPYRNLIDRGGNTMRKLEKSICPKSRLCSACRRTNGCRDLP